MKKGNAASQHKMGQIAYNQENYDTAFEWLQKSAKNDFAPAQYELGLMYYYGKGVAKNTQKAAQWIEKAYESGNLDAEKVWNSLELWKYK